jgi:aspartyl/asparaginyl beta-hydroxylase (cupin superfamily)
MQNDFESKPNICFVKIPLAVRGVCFARQEPGSGVAPHSDGRNFILTSHLGLKVPEGCWIKVGEEERSWEVGRLTTLDTSFTHSTGNDSKEDRHVSLICHNQSRQRSKYRLTSHTIFLLGFDY